MRQLKGQDEDAFNRSHIISNQIILTFYFSEKKPTQMHPEDRMPYESLIILKWMGKEVIDSDSAVNE